MGSIRVARTRYPDRCNAGTNRTRFNSDPVPDWTIQMHPRPQSVERESHRDDNRPDNLQRIPDLSHRSDRWESRFLPRMRRTHTLLHCPCRRSPVLRSERPNGRLRLFLWSKCHDSILIGPQKRALQKIDAIRNRRKDRVQTLPDRFRLSWQIDNQ